MAPRTKRTPEVEKTLLDAIAAGNFVTTACRVARVSKDSFDRWVKQSADFAALVAEAEAAAEAEAVKHWRSAIREGDWRAAAEYLARRHPENWRKTENHKVEGAMTITWEGASPDDV